MDEFYSSWPANYRFYDDHIAFVFVIIYMTTRQEVAWTMIIQSNEKPQTNRCLEE